MFRKSIIHLHRNGINVSKEGGCIPGGFNVHSGVAKVGRASHEGDVAVHYHGGHAIAWFKV
jgi:hypothetical protein